MLSRPYKAASCGLPMKWVNKISQEMWHVFCVRRLKPSHVHRKGPEKDALLEYLTALTWFSRRSALETLFSCLFQINGVLNFLSQKLAHNLCLAYYLRNMVGMRSSSPSPIFFNQNFNNQRRRLSFSIHFQGQFWSKAL